MWARDVGILDQSGDDEIVHWLLLVGLGGLVDNLDEVADWQTQLSLGQVQQIGFVKILLASADVIFLDEATSALDEVNQELMYTLLATHLPESIVVSIGHRGTLRKFHHKVLQISTTNLEKNNV